MYVAFDSLPEFARIWAYQAERQFTPDESKKIHQTLEEFCKGWNSHGNLMPTSFQVVDNQIVILAVDESQLGASGCSIDSSVKTLKILENQLNINLTDQGKVSFKRQGGRIYTSSALGIKSKVNNGEITSDSLVINPMIRTKKDLERIWIRANESWLNKYFPN